MVPFDQGESTLFVLPSMTCGSDAHCTEQMVSYIDYTVIAPSAIIAVRQSILLKSTPFNKACQK